MRITEKLSPGVTNSRPWAFPQNFRVLSSFSSCMSLTWYVCVMWITAIFLVEHKKPSRSCRRLCIKTFRSGSGKNIKIAFHIKLWEVFDVVVLRDGDGDEKDDDERQRRRRRSAVCFSVASGARRVMIFREVDRKNENSSRCLGPLCRG